MDCSGLREPPSAAASGRGLRTLVPSSAGATAPLNWSPGGTAHKARRIRFPAAGDGNCRHAQALGCGYAVMKRGVNAVTGNLAVGIAAGLATGGLLGRARNTIKCGGCGTKYLQG